VETQTNVTGLSDDCFARCARYNDRMFNHLRISLRRPRYSLRLLFACLAVVALVTAVYREPLRRRLEALLAGKHKPIEWVEIVGPKTAGLPVALDPPSPAEIVRAAALEDARDLRMVVEPLADYVDPLDISSMPAKSRLHHARYKCMIHWSNGSTTLYVDHVHRVTQ
jgi:hypothetical protein